MNKKFLTLAIALVVLAMIVAPVAAKPFDWKSMCTKPNSDLTWLPVCDLLKMVTDQQNQITNIKLTPGPTGPQGPTGSAGKDGTNGAAGATGPTGPAGKDGSGATVHFGDWDITSYVKTTKYTATTDGFVVGTGACDGTTICSLHQIAKFDSIGDPALGFDDRVDIIPGSQVALTIPVKAGDTWGVWAASDVTVHIRWIPLSA